MFLDRSLQSCYTHPPCQSSAYRAHIMKRIENWTQDPRVNHYSPVFCYSSEYKSEWKHCFNVGCAGLCGFTHCIKCITGESLGNLAGHCLIFLQAYRIDCHLTFGLVETCFVVLTRVQSTKSLMSGVELKLKTVYKKYEVEEKHMSHKNAKQNSL